MFLPMGILTSVFSPCSLTLTRNGFRRLWPHIAEFEKVEDRLSVR